MNNPDRPRASTQPGAVAANPSASIVSIAPRQDRAAKVRRLIFNNVREMLAANEGCISGFALVVWNDRGVATSNICCGEGPVGVSLVPAFTSDALNRIIAQWNARNDE